MLQKIKNFLCRTGNIGRSFKIALVVIGLVGLIDSSYLTYAHYKAHPINCFTEIKQVNSCQIVAESIYSTILGVPVSLIGLCFYLVIITIGLLSFKKDFTFLLNLLLPFSALAVLFSLRLTYLQIYVIGYICYYCILSAILSCVLLGTSWKIYNQLNNLN